MTTTARRRREDTPRVTAHVPGHVDSREHFEHGVDVLDGVLQEDPNHHHRRNQHPLRRVWLFLISMRTGLWIILMLGILTLFGTLLMQATPEARADQATYEQWLAGAPTERYGGWVGILDKLGLFHVFSTWYFQGLFVLLSANIIACSINRAPRLWRVATQPHTSMRDAFFSHAPLRATIDLPGDVESSAQIVRDAFDGKPRGLVAVSRDQARAHPEADWTVIHNGVTFRPPPLADVAGDDLCFVGRMSPEKGFPDAIEVCNRIG